MRYLPLLVFPLLIVIGALGNAAAEEVDLITYADEAHFFTIGLPPGIVRTESTDPDWAEDPTTAFDWQSEDDSFGIYSITGRVDYFEYEITDELFEVFMDGVDGGWAEQAGYEVQGEDDYLDTGGRIWANRQIYSTVDPQVPLFFETFSSYADTRVFTITVIYYYEPSDVDLDNAYSILTTFVPQ
jgi:hypothetical protein